MILFDMLVLEYLLLVFLIASSLAVSLSRRTLIAIIIFMSYGIVMSLVWVLLDAPDLALTEAAVGAGVTSVLFFLTLKRINTMEEARNERKGKE